METVATRVTVGSGPPTFEPGIPRRPVMLGRLELCGQLQYRYLFGIGPNDLVRSAVKSVRAQGGTASPP